MEQSHDTLLRGAKRPEERMVKERDAERAERPDIQLDLIAALDSKIDDADAADVIRQLRQERNVLLSAIVQMERDREQLIDKIAQALDWYMSRGM